MSTMKQIVLWPSPIHSWTYTLRMSLLHNVNQNHLRYAQFKECHENLNLAFQIKQGYTRDEVEHALTFAKLATKIMTGQGEGIKFDSGAGEMLKMICKEVQVQKKRLGGDFAVALAVFSRKSRDLCRHVVSFVLKIFSHHMRTSKRRKIQTDMI